MKKYNIALLPLSRENDFIVLAQNFSRVPTNYQLGPKSVPHVTICQFYANEIEIDLLWKKTCSILYPQTIYLKFKHFSFITFDGVTFWVSLVPDRLLALEEMHSELASIITPSSRKRYDPHLTLISTVDETYEGKIKHLITRFKPVADKFVLSLGECDELGQFTKIIYQIKESSSVT